jgi:hypothetical protein
MATTNLKTDPNSDSDPDPDENAIANGLIKEFLEYGN